MESKQVAAKKKRTLLSRILRIFGWIIASVIFLIILVLILIQIPAVQNFGRKKIASYLEHKLNTKVEIGRLDINFPTALALKNVYIEDQSKDTLLYGGELAVDISMLKLLKNEIRIQEISLDHIVTKIKKLPPDSTFNFQFIVDAFVSENQKEPEKQDTAPLKMSIERILIKNSRILYKDAYSGNDMDMAIGNFETHIKTFDPSHLLFDVPQINLKGLRGHFYQIEPLEKSIEKTVAEAAEEPENILRFINKEMKFSDIDFAFNSDPSQLKTSFVLKDLIVHPQDIDLKNSIITLKDAMLDQSVISISLASAQPDQPANDTLVINPTPPMQIRSGSIVIKNSAFKYDDISAPKAPSGMDYSHLHLKDLNLNATDLKYSPDSIFASIQSGSLSDQSGFVLNKFHTRFAMIPTGVSLENLYIQTPGSIIQQSASISYPSLEAIKENPGVLGLDINLKKTKLAAKDIAFFVPQMATHIPAGSTLYADARITGTVGNMNFEQLILNGFNGTHVDITGSVRGLPDPERIFADLNIKKFQTNKKDLLAFIPPGTIPPNITIPHQINASGKLKGGMDNLYTDLSVKTDLGGATVKGTLANPTDENKSQYNLALNASQLQLGKMLQNPKLGSLTGHFTLAGKGFNPDIAQATFMGNIQNVTLNNYNYKNINATGSIANKSFKINADVKDPNLDITLAANGQITEKFPTIQLTAMVDSIKTLPLHFTDKPMSYHGNISANFTSTDPDNLQGKMFITNSILVNDGERTTIDTLQLLAENINGVKSIDLTADFLSASIKGDYTLTQIGSVFQQAIDPYFALSTTKDTTTINPYHFQIAASIVDHPALRAFLPELKQLKPININGNFASDSGWNMNMQIPLVVYGTNIIDDAKLIAATKEGALAYNFSIKQVKNGESFIVYATTLDGTLKDNVAKFNLAIQDQKAAKKYALSGMLSQPSSETYIFNLSPDNLMLNYQPWTVSTDNAINYTKGDLAAHNFILIKNDQKLSIQSTTQEANSPLEVAFTNFKIGTLTSFVQSDSLLVNGILNGKALVRNIKESPNFETDLVVTDLSIYNDTIGVLKAKIDNNIADTYHADINLSGRGNDVKILGDYNIKPDDNSTFDLVLDVVQFQMKSLEGFSKGALKDSRGFLFGKVTAKGSLKDPNVDGKINFNETSFNVTQLNNVFRIDKEAIAIISNKGVRFDKFSIRDTINNTLTLNGSIDTDDFTDYKFNMGIRANKFQAVNSTKKDNNLFYGKMIFSTNLSIKGTPDHPIVDGDLTINDNTEFSVVLPQEDPSVQSLEGIVRFVDMDATAEDSLFMKPYDSLNISRLIGYDVSVNINVEKDAVFNLIVDEGNGDFLRLKGTAQLNGGIDASGKITLVGSYEIEEGSYDLSFNFIKRKFNIQKGSRMVWTGEPTSAQIDVTAIYTALTAPLDLVQGQLTGDPNIFKQKLPFEVHLKMEGELLKPQISFDVVLPTEKNYTVASDVTSTVQTKLIQLRQEPGEMNKQVFALLLLNRFVGENPFENSASGGMDATSFAKQSVSKLLTEQLNNLAGNLIQGVDINFDLATTEDYTTGKKEDRTDFNVGVSKRLLNDRLTITVGSNFELEGPQQGNQQANNVAGNININYKLSKDGRYALRAYRKNDYTGTIEGYVVETGLGFIMTVDYNKFKEIFTSRQSRQQKRQIKRANEEADKKNAAQKAEEHNAIPPNEKKIENEE